MILRILSWTAFIVCFKLSGTFLVAQGIEHTDARDSLYYSSFSEWGYDSTDFYHALDSIIYHAIDTGAFPGCQVLIAKNNAILVQKSYGYHTYHKESTVKNSDLYDLASVTKIAATTLALMKLYDEGKFDLEQTMGYYFPFLARSDKKNLTMRKVLAHQSGLKSWIPYYKESQRSNGNFRRNTISSDSSGHFPYKIPGSDLYLHKNFYDAKLKRMIKKSDLYDSVQYVYSGLSFYLFPELVERLSGKPFDDYLDSNFYKPMGLSNLLFKPLDKYSLETIVPTEIDSFFRMNTLHGVVHDEGAAFMLGVSGNSGLFGNSLAIAKLMQMLNNGGVYNGKRYLSQATINEFTKCQYCDFGNRRGLGFDKPLIVYDEVKSSVAKATNPNSFGHSGYTGTLVWADPISGVLFVFLSNRVYPSRDNKLIYQLNIRPEIHTLVYDLIEEGKE